MPQTDILQAFFRHARLLQRHVIVPIKPKENSFCFVIPFLCATFAKYKIPEKKTINIVRMRHPLPTFLFPFAVIIAVLMLASCSSSKFVPDNEYLLDRVEIKADQKGFDASLLEPYIRQKANSRWFSVFKIPLGTYSLAGKDSTKWLNRTLQRIGETPVIFDTIQARLSTQDLTTAMRNMGYMNAIATIDTRVKGKKLTATYTLHPGEPYHITRFDYDIQDSVIARVLQNHIGTMKDRLPIAFTVPVLDAERKRLTAILNDSGYYRFHKEFIIYTADSIEGTNNIGVTLQLMKYRANSKSPETLHPRYRISEISYQQKDSTESHLRPSVLTENTMLEKGKWYSATALQNTYNRFARLGAIRYTNIDFQEHADSLTLDANLQISTLKPNTISFQPEGTNTAGDLGAAATLMYQNRNLFHGSELLSIQLRAAFEAITGLEGYENHDYEEYGVDASLQFPRMVAPFLSSSFKRHSTATSELGVSWNMQNRPEFHRRVFSASWRYKWNDHTGKTNYQLDVLDLSYVYMPWISQTFKHDYIDSVSNRNAILRYNYEDLFIMKTGFGFRHTTRRYGIRANIETAGNLLNAVAKVANFKKNESGQNTLLNIAYAQYAKFDFDFTRWCHLDHTNLLALHAGFGIAYPYGNSTVLPFEKRYFSGGANSVRGWSVRSLGPGRYKGQDGRIDFINQTGDLKIDLNAELRTHLFWKLDGAVFVDAGNIWTLRAYDEQPGGQFKLKNLLREMAVAYGLGIRLNFSYFIVRFDAGMKAINPAYDTKEEHYAIIHPDFSRDFTFHFAVGLPF